MDSHLLLLKYIQYNVNKLIDYDLNNNLSFSELARKLNDKNLLNICKTTLTLIVKNRCNIHVKKFLSCYMIVNHNNVIISDNSELERSIIKLSEKIISMLKYISQVDNITDYYFYQFVFNMYYTKYLEFFDEWKNFDKVKIINDLCVIYFELESDKQKKYENIDKESNKEFIISLEREQKKIINKIENIGGYDGIKHLKNLEKEMEEYKSKIKKLYINIQDNLHDAYWHSIQLELQKEPPNNMVICELLEQLKEMLVNCNTKIKQELDTKIDIEFITQMIKHNAIDNHYIYNMCLYIMGFIEQYQSKAHDDSTQKWKKGILEDFSKGIVNSEFFPKFFRGVFEKIQIILYEIDIYNFITQNIQK